MASNKLPVPTEKGEVIVERTQKDVLCGRGVQVLHHVGNLNLHLAAIEFRDEYLRSRRSRKKEIIETIVQRLKATGSRFLRYSKADKTKWVEAEDSFAYHKVSHVLRGQNTGKVVRKMKEAEGNITQEGTSPSLANSQPRPPKTVPSLSQNRDLGTGIPVQLQGPSLLFSGRNMLSASPQPGNMSTLLQQANQLGNLLGSLKTAHQLQPGASPKFGPNENSQEHLLSASSDRQRSLLDQSILAQQAMAPDRLSLIMSRQLAATNPSSDVVTSFLLKNLTARSNPGGQSNLRD
eukprot:scaffold16066_cov109-Cylindrotheca_fusiformis.AAC.8